MTDPRTTLVLDEAAIAALAEQTGLGPLYDEATKRLTEFLAAPATSVRQKPRDGFRLDNPDPGLLEWMPAVRLGSTVMVKLVGYHPHNPSKHNLPTILSTVCVFDVSSGHLRTLMDGTFVTVLRTGVASLVASRLLADPQSQVLGLVGCGAHSITQLHALFRGFPLSEVLVCDQDAEAESSFATRSRAPAGLVRVVPSKDLQARSDIICTTTSVRPGAGPVITGDDVKPGVHINAVGSDMPGKTELPLELLRVSTVCPDDQVQASKEGECQQLSLCEIGPTLAELVREPDRYAGLRQVRTVFDSTGLALADLAMAELLEELAADLGIGYRVGLEASSGDPRDPVAFLSDQAARSLWS